mmetsp:Transcript_12887/g.26116  ORF Transcript_12887/g.26116 Transcript_12887/m.26116 type:complete len:83 (+) Transcript_12887:1775-2023(+)
MHNQGTMFPTASAKVSEVNPAMGLDLRAMLTTLGIEGSEENAAGSIMFYTTLDTIVVRHLLGDLWTIRRTCELASITSISPA